MAKSKIKSGKDIAILTTLLIAAAVSILLIIFPPFNLTGAFSAGNSNWESKISIEATSEQQTITKHIVFSENKPINCAIGIFVEAPDGKEIPFKTTNEVYDKQGGVCSETDVVFDNKLYQSPAPQPAPPGNGGPAPPSFDVSGTGGTETITYSIYYGKISEVEAQPTFQTQATNITSCTTINSGGIYELNGTITASSELRCITISANNTILDCKGYNITNTGTATYAIFVWTTSINNLTIQNCVIRNFMVGIDTTYAISNANLINNTVVPTVSGIYHAGKDSIVENNTVENSTGCSGYSNPSSCPAFYFSASSNVTVRNNVARNLALQQGFQTSSMTGSISNITFINNNAQNINGSGFVIGAGSNVTLINTTVINIGTVPSYTSGEGLRFSVAVNASGINISGTSSDSMVIGSNSNISDVSSGGTINFGGSNTILNNAKITGGNGIDIRGASSNNISNVSISGGGFYGISIGNGAANNNILSNINITGAATAVYVGYPSLAQTNNKFYNINLTGNTIAVYVRYNTTGTSFTNVTLGNSTLSFEARNITVRETSPVSPPSNLNAIGLYFNATQIPLTSTPQMLLNWSYNASALGSVDENTLNISKYNSTGGGTWYTNPSAFASSYGVNTTADYVYANITNFGSTFAPLGNATGGGGAGTSTCMNVTASGYYTLTQNITNSTNIICINISASNVVFDGQGYLIDGNDTSATYGISAFNAATLTNITVKNVILTDWWSAIKFQNVQNSSITNNTATSNLAYVAHLLDSDYNTIENNNVSVNNPGGASGIYVELSDSNIINNNNASYNYYGIEFATGYYNNVTNNTANNNSGDGIHFGAQDVSNRLINNNASANSGAGIFVTSPGGSNTLANNTANSNNNYGIQLASSTGNNLINNSIVSNQQYGILLSSAGYNNLTNNNLSSNTIWDFYSLSSSNVWAINNTFSSYPTTVNFTYAGNVGLKGVASPPSDSGGYHNISKYINATNVSANAWLFLNVSYNQTTDVDPLGLDENTLNMSKYNNTGGGTWYTDPSVFANPSGVNATADYVYANITNFGSIFAPLGLPSGGAGNVSCNLTIFVNGVEASNFTNAAEPVNVTVNVTDSSSGYPVNLANIEAHEYNGYTFFVMPQFQDSNISNDIYAKVKTNLYGLASMTLVPTGARYVNTSILGDYNITIIANSPCNNSANKTLYVVDKEFPTPSSAVSIPNRGQIDSFKTETLRIYDRVKGWLALGGGEKKDIVMNLGDSNVKLFDAVAGKPYAVNLSVTGGSGENFKINVTETNGYPPFALPQSADSYVSNIAKAYFSNIGYGTEIHFTMVPTGGRYFSGSEAYAINITAYNSTGVIASGYVNVADRNLPQPSGAQQGLFNQGNIDSFKTEILRIYDRIKGWLSL